MINSINSFNIDGVKFDKFDINNAFTVDENDTFRKWFFRPLAVLAAIGIGVATFFASAILIMITLALSPILVMAMWAIRTKLERELKQSGIGASSIVITEYQAGSDSQTKS
ncbi:hypothetical protein AB833_31385 [Chromatiales bacterium (ex Bugula neritina AB1)]|nr:hypothetical protein AB833_31385 [Chromatiales bacterium (ex Bugula neritina AB1)]